jgi:hypothetical protein
VDETTRANGKRFIWNFLAPLDYFHNNPSALMEPGAAATGTVSNREIGKEEHMPYVIAGGDPDSMPPNAQ